MSGGGQTTQTTKNALPAWAVPYAQGLLGMGAQEFAPGGQPGQMPANMNQQVYGMTPDQLQAMSMIQQRAGLPALQNIPSAANIPQGIAQGSQVAGPVQTIQGLNAPASNPPVAANPPLPPPVAPTPPPTKKKKKK